MIVVIQKVSSASVEVSSKTVGEIAHGYLILLGIRDTDTKSDVDYLAEKLLKVRLFPDDKDRFDKTLTDVDGEVLIVPQYTLYGDIKSKNSPSFTHAMKPDQASVLFDLFCTKMESMGIKVQKGKFREYMQVKLTNEGPVTFILESNNAKN